MGSFSILVSVFVYIHILNELQYMNYIHILNEFCVSHVHRYPGKPEGIRPGAIVPGDCEPPEVHAGN